MRQSDFDFVIVLQGDIEKKQQSLAGAGSRSAKADVVTLGSQQFQELLASHDLLYLVYACIRSQHFCFVDGREYDLPLEIDAKKLASSINIRAAKDRMKAAKMFKKGEVELAAKILFHERRLHLLGKQLKVQRRITDFSAGLAASYRRIRASSFRLFEELQNSVDNCVSLDFHKMNAEARANPKSTNCLALENTKGKAYWFPHIKPAAVMMRVRSDDSYTDDSTAASGDESSNGHFVSRESKVGEANYSDIARAPDAEGMSAGKKYPRTPHLPFSPCVHSDDIVASERGIDWISTNRVVITEKLDGGNCCISEGKVYARTHAAEASHPSFGPVKQLAESLYYEHWQDGGILQNLTLYGENMFGIHSVEYDSLNSFFYLFGILRKDGLWLSWDECKRVALEIGVPTVPEIACGVFTAQEIRSIMDRGVAGLSSLSSSNVGPEGYVLRLQREFPSGEFMRSVAKYVRKGHVQTDSNWRRTWKKASLRR